MAAKPAYPDPNWCFSAVTRLVFFLLIKSAQIAY